MNLSIPGLIAQAHRIRADFPTRFPKPYRAKTFPQSFPQESRTFPQLFPQPKIHYEFNFYSFNMTIYFIFTLTISIA
jgi:hypothetical protein